MAEPTSTSEKPAAPAAPAAPAKTREPRLYDEITYRDPRGVDRPAIVTRLNPGSINLIAFGVNHGDEAAALEVDVKQDPSGIQIHRWRFAPTEK